MKEYICKNCGFKEEYSTSKSVPKDLNPPEKCPKCNGKIELKNRFYSSFTFDCGPGSYEYEYGKKAWMKNLSETEQAKVLLNEREPY